MNYADPIIKRMAERAVLLGQSPDETIDQVKSMNAPRWSISPQWITFDCGCRGERCLTLHGVEAYDPVIFAGQPEQAVYEGVCDFHLPSMNSRLRLGGFVDFIQWSRDRRRRLMGKVF